MTKFQYLETLRKTDGTFKRVSRMSPLRYAGGKTKGIGPITQYLPDVTPQRIISPFLGGGSLEIAWANNLDTEEVVGSDVFAPLVLFWQVLLETPGDLADALGRLKLGKENYTRYKEQLREWFTGTRFLSDTKAAALYYYNMQLSYGPMFLGWTSPMYMDDVAGWKRTIQMIREFRCPKLRVKCCSFEDALTAYPNDFVYADPPYLLGYDSSVFKGIYPNQGAANHKGFPHEHLRNILKARSSEWLLSYNDCGTIRTWYEGYNHTFPKWQYTYQQGETRTNGEKHQRDSRKDGREILIVNTHYTLNHFASLF